MPHGVLEVLRLGHTTALAKPDGVSKTIDHQIGDQGEKATVPFQFVLKTRAGVCGPHTPHTVGVERSHNVGAFDLISRSAKWSEGVAVCPHVLLHPIPVLVGG